MDAGAARQDAGRGVGAIAGALIGILPAAIGLIEPDLEILVQAGGLGAIAGGLLGALYGRRVGSISAAAAPLLAVRMAVLAVLLGDVLASCLLVLNSIGYGGYSGYGNVLEMLGAVPVLALLGLAVFGLPAFGLALIAGFAWVAVMRVVPRRWVGRPPAVEL